MMDGDARRRTSPSARHQAPLRSGRQGLLSMPAPSVPGRVPRLRPRRPDTPTRRNEPFLFASDCQRPVRVVVDPRLSAETLPWPLRLLLDNPLVEIGTVGYSSDNNVRIFPVLADRRVIPLYRDDGWHSAIQQYDNLQRFAAARAPSYGVEAEPLREGLVFTEAAAFWDADFFITGSEELQTLARNYTRELDVLSVDQSIPLLGLFLRSRGKCVLPDPDISSEWRVLARWWFYRVGAWALLPEANAGAGAAVAAVAVAHPATGSGSKGFGTGPRERATRWRSGGASRLRSNGHTTKPIEPPSLIRASIPKSRSKSSRRRVARRLRLLPPAAP
jgi:hypothetical protein